MNHFPSAGHINEPNVAFQLVSVNSAEAERAYRRGIRLVEQTGTDTGTLGELYLEAGGFAGQAEAIGRRALKLAEESYDSDSEKLSNFIYVLGVAQNQSRDGKIRRGLILANLGEHGPGESAGDHGDTAWP